MKKIVYLLNFICKGWEVGLLLLLPFLKDSYGISIVDVGLITMVFVIAQLVTTLLAGQLSRVIGSKSVLTFSVLSYSIAWLLIAVAGNTEPILWLAYGFGGIGSGFFVPIASSVIAKLASKGNTGKELGDYDVFGDMGRIGLVPLVTTLAGLLGVPKAAYAFAALSGVLWLITLRLPVENASISATKELHASAFLFLKNRPFLLSLMTGAVDSFASSSLYIFIPFLLEIKGVGLLSTGLFTALFFVGYMAGRATLGRLADRHGAWRVVAMAEVGMAVLTLLLVVVQPFWLVLTILFLLGVFTRGTSPVVRSMVAHAVPEKSHFDQAYSLYSFTSRSSLAVSRPIFGAVAGYFGIAYVFYAAAAVALLAVAPAARYGKLSSKNSPE